MPKPHDLEICGVKLGTFSGDWDDIDLLILGYDTFRPEPRFAPYFGDALLVDTIVVDYEKGIIECSQHNDAREPCRRLSLLAMLRDETVAMAQLPLTEKPTAEEDPARA